MIMNKRPLISIIIPTFNHGRLVAGAVESALSQTYPRKEVIVVDDGSRDNTRDALEPLRDRIRYVYQENRGLSAARNTGIREAKGEYVAILDADDIWLNVKLEEQMKIFAEDKSAGLVSCGSFEMDDTGRVFGENVPRDPGDQNRLRENLLVKNIVSGGSNALIKKECFDAVGLFDEGLKSAEDWDMWLRIARRYSVRFVQRPLVKVRTGQNTMSGIRNASKMLENELKVLDKYYAGNIDEIISSPSIKAQAYGYRHFCAAWAYDRSGDLARAQDHIVQAARYSPRAVFGKQQGGLMLKIIVKRMLRFSVPVNTLTRPVFKGLYKAHIFLREGLIVLFKFMYYEPLFRSQCAHVGKGLWMEKLPYITGQGEITIGDHVRLSGRPSFAFSRKVYNDPKLTIGDHTFIAHNTAFFVAREIRVGRHCYIANGSMIADNDGHPLEAEKRRQDLPPNKDHVKPTVIGDDVWVARQAVILKGVRVGDRAVIGARAVVREDVPEGAVVAGNPAKILKTLEK